MAIKVLYHANCMDGFVSAWVAHTKFGNNAEYIPVQYGTPPPDVVGHDVYIVDFSYPKMVLEEMIRKSKSLTVCDHHKTAAAELKDVKNEKGPIIFDMNMSGARLTWNHFYADKSNWLVDYAEDRDLWLFKLPYSREISDALSSYPFDFHIFDTFATYKADNSDPNFMKFVAEGQAINRYKMQVVANAVDNAVEIELDGHKVLAAHTTILFSEIAGKLAEGRPFGVAWFIRKDGVKQWSLRSRDQGEDVSVIAKAHNGGGHRNAAGFEEKVSIISEPKAVPVVHEMGISQAVGVKKV